MGNWRTPSVICSRLTGTTGKVIGKRPLPCSANIPRSQAAPRTGYGYPIPGGYRLLGVKRLGASVTRLIYLQENDRFFIPWAFSFYKAAGEWRLTHISFPDVGSDDIRDFIVIVPAAP